MTFESRRSVSASQKMMLNVLALTASGTHLIWSTRFDAIPNHLWTEAGAVFLLWAAFVLCNVARPARFRLTVNEAFAQSAIGNHRFGWDALTWIAFARPNDTAGLCHARSGSERVGFGILSRKATTDIERVEVMEQRPTMPQSNPQIFVSMRKRTA